MVQFEGILPEAAPCIAYAPVDLDGQVGIVLDVSPEVYKLVRLVVHSAVRSWRIYRSSTRPLVSGRVARIALRGGFCLGAG